MDCQLPAGRWHGATLLAAFLVFLGLSAISPPHPDDFLWEHILTALTLAFLIAVSYTLIFIYMLMHTLGARYTYSEVPYDRWSQAITGVRISDLIGASAYGEHGQPRNHYDRLVHFSFGLLLLVPMCELIERWLTINRLRAVAVAAAFLCVLGTFYEILEWLYAEVMGQEAAEKYNGQQGDMFDAQKDIALNLAGSTISGVATIVAELRRRRRVI